VVDPMLVEPDGFSVAWFGLAGERGSPLADAAEVAFEDARPVRSFASYRGQRHFPGWNWCASNGRHVAFESWLERDHAMLLDFDPDVAGLAAQPFALGWPDQMTGRRRSHVPDFFARTLSGDGVVVDCRPPERIDEKTAIVFAVMAQACDVAGWAYRVVGPVEPVRAANLRWLAGYRHPRFAVSEALAAAVAAAFVVPAPLFAQAATVGEPLMVLPVVFQLLWRGGLGADLSLPLTDHTTVWSTRGLA
jgi:hypothetical protein